MRLKESKDAELVRSSVPIAGENDGYVDAQPEIEDCSNGIRAAAEYSGGRQSEDDRAGRRIDDTATFLRITGCRCMLTSITACAAGC